MSTVIEEIVIKKPRAPRMSKIVSKAVLLKQLSEQNLLQATPLLTGSEALKENSCADKLNETVLEVVKEVDPVKDVVKPVQISITSYKCQLCNTVFTSKTLYERHPRTIKHLTNVVKERDELNKTALISSASGSVAMPNAGGNKNTPSS